ncbi:MAG: LysR family transcriptional regulator [Candidatus Krumholzibacteria bacterium]|nr:LysR family transcriptional regulator [Candidatus Krumholzibacteria bacterium]
MEPRAKLFLFSPDAEGLFGDGKWRLLKEINRQGSIQKAAKTLGRGYRKAWGDIKRAEHGFGRRLVTKTRGGPSGGSTELTEFGSGLLDAWERYREEVASCVNDAYNRHVKGIVEGA